MRKAIIVILLVALLCPFMALFAFADESEASPSESSEILFDEYFVEVMNDSFVIDSSNAVFYFAPMLFPSVSWELFSGVYEDGEFFPLSSFFRSSFSEWEIVDGCYSAVFNVNISSSFAAVSEKYSLNTNWKTSDEIMSISPLMCTVTPYGDSAAWLYGYSYGSLEMLSDTTFLDPGTYEVSSNGLFCYGYYDLVAIGADIESGNISEDVLNNLSDYLFVDDSWECVSSYYSSDVRYRLFANNPPISQDPVTFGDAPDIFMIFVDVLWSYVVVAVSWILTPDLWLLLIPFLAFLSIIAAATLRSVARGT